MRNVPRTPKPPCLATNSHRWRREFLEAIRGSDVGLIKRRRGRYNHEQVRRALDSMYRNLCCYCESQVGPVRADQIEHRMPVDGFPESAFEWDNLHLACGGCNRAKSNKWDTANPVLDAVADMPIDHHLGYECSNTGVRRVWRTPRGRTTVSDTDLNRERLREARNATMIKVVGLIQEIRTRFDNDPADSLAANRREELEEMRTGQYGSMIRW